MNVTLYTRKGCHLCEQAHQTLIEHGITPTVFDIEDDQRLCEEFDTCVPVVVIDGKERFRGRVNEVLLRRLLAARDR